MIKDSRFKCIYSDINVQVQIYLSMRLLLRPFMIASMGATLISTVLFMCVQLVTLSGHSLKPCPLRLMQNLTLSKPNCHFGGFNDIL